MNIWNLFKNCPKYLTCYLALFAAIRPNVQASVNSHSPVVPCWANITIAPVLPFTLDYAPILNRFNEVTKGYDQDYKILEENFVSLYENSTPWEQQLFEKVLFSEGFKIEIIRKQDTSFCWGKTGENTRSTLSYSIGLKTINVYVRALERKDLAACLRHEFLHALVQGQLPKDPVVMDELKTLSNDLILALNHYHQGIFDPKVQHFMTLFNRLSPQRYEHIRHSFNTNDRKMTKGELTLYLIASTLGTYAHEYSEQAYSYKLYEERVATLFGYLEPDILVDLAPHTYDMIDRIANDSRFDLQYKNK